MKSGLCILEEMWKLVTQLFIRDSDEKKVILIWSMIYMPGNVVRGNQNYANEILTGASGHDLQSVDRMSPNLLPVGNLAMWFPISFISIQD